jgi:ELWxxDGT repeat protein
MNNELFFAADNGHATGQLWKSDGTPTGTTLVKETNPLSDSPLPFALTNVAGTLLFAGYDDTHRFELWRSDGTTAGTSLVMDINPGTAEGLTPCYSRQCLASQFVAINKTLFFTATDGQHGFELWKSDGTAAGTMQVKDINPGSPDSFPVELTNMNGTLFFRALVAQGQAALW